MNSINNTNQVIILFDEQGTPTFRTDRETNSFLGVAITYDLYDEDNLLNQCNQLFGLSKTRPLKNKDISNTRVVNISNLLIELPIQIIISSVDLSNAEFEEVVTLYEEFGNVMRKRYRNIRERRLAHILHTKILDNCIYNSICDYAERNQRNSIFSIYIDDWAIPENDVNIYLEDRSLSFHKKINSLYQEFYSPFQISVPTILLLKEDNNRKRFIDVIASVISRSFLKKENERYSEIPFNTIINVDTNRYFEITNKTMKDFRDFMDESSRNPPVL